MYQSVGEKCETGASGQDGILAPASTTSASSQNLMNSVSLAQAASAFSPLDLRGGMGGIGVIIGSNGGVVVADDEDDGVDSDCSADINVESDDDIHLHVSPTQQSPAGSPAL